MRIFSMVSLENTVSFVTALSLSRAQSAASYLVQNTVIYNRHYHEFRPDVASSDNTVCRIITTK